MLRIEQASSPSPNTVERGIDCLFEGREVITQTQRLRHLIEDGYNRVQHNNGRISWQTAKVYTWDAWLRQNWEQYRINASHSVPTLLQHGQALHLWEDVIASSLRQQYHEEYAYALWHITATALSVRNAYGLTCLYEVKLSEFGELISVDVQNFIRWLKRYRDRLHERNWIDSESLPTQFAQHVDKIFDCSEINIAFVGFDELTCQHQRFINSLKEQGAQIDVIDLRTSGTPKSIQQYKFETAEEEIVSCARWARSVIEANPEVHRVGIVVPQIGTMLQRITRSFSEYLNPNEILDKRQPANLSFHITQGSPLSQVPMIVDALNLIEIINSQVDFSVMCSVIQSDRLKGWESESVQRSSLAAEIIGIGGSKISIEEVLAFTKRYQFNCPALSRVFRSAEQLRTESKTKADYAYWGEFFTKWLANFQSNSRENRMFSATELQAHRSWNSLIESLTALSLVSVPVSATTAISKLRRLVSEVTIQPRAVRVPIQIGEMVAMSGQSFTHLWTLGMNNSTIPGTPHPTPFIPVKLQKLHDFPQSSGSSLYQRIKRRMDNLIGGAQIVVQSYAATDEGQYFQPSGMLQNLQDFECDENSQLLQYTDYKSLLSTHSERCEEYSDWQVAKVAEPQHLTGGTTILKLQSQCPFRAFAEKRLHATQLAGSVLGISPLARGSLIHSMFERLYEDSQSIRKVIKEADRDEYLRRARKIAKEEIDKYNSDIFRSFDADYVITELDRMVAIADQFFTEEIKRVGMLFSSVRIESRISGEVAGIPISGKIDRIDDRGDGSLLVIDYKTGRCSLNDLKGYRMKEPQLLIYACLLQQQGERVGAITYAKVKMGETQLLKEKKQKNQFERYGVQVDSLNLENWNSYLEEIATNFLQGDAGVDPMDGACNYCHISPICRKNEISERYPDIDNKSFR